tara:strand:- start:2936 stop:3535 length:600 start_codon:yes stop_codon:yes gene_type:complete
MVHNKTYNNVVNTLLHIGEKYQGIQTTSVGDIFDIDLEKNTKFPLLHITPTNVTTGDSTLTYNFQIFVMSMVTEESNWTQNRAPAGTPNPDATSTFNKLYKTLNNEQTVYSEMLQVCTDFISMLRHSIQQSKFTSTPSEHNANDINAPIYFTEGQFTIEPFSERFDNLCVGWVFNMGILVQNNFDACNAPIPLTRGAGY